MQNMILFNEMIKRQKLQITYSDKKQLEFDEKISENLGDELSKSQIGDAVFVDSVTGTGKTYAIENVLYEHARMTGDGVVILSNRRVLKNQLDNDIRLHELYEGRRDVGILTYLYQELESDEKIAKDRKATIQKCKYIVCDECHYFLSDGSFNAGTQKSFEFLLECYSKSVLIFMSATINNIRPLIEDALSSIFNQQYTRWQEKKDNWIVNTFDKCYYYKDGSKRSFSSFCEMSDKIENSLEFDCDLTDFEESKPHMPEAREFIYRRDISPMITPRSYRDLDEAIGYIESNAYKGKWLINVLSKISGRALAKAIRKKCNLTKKDVVVVDADYTDFSDLDENKIYAKKEVERIVNSGRFKCKFLICTTVLDNGINFNMPDLKNILLMTTDETEFKQMLGRKRFISEDDKINLFLWEGKVGTFKKHAYKEYRTYWDICNRKQMELKDLIYLGTSDSRKYITLANFLNHYNYESGSVNYSELGIEAMRIKKIENDNIIKGMALDEDFFIKLQLQWAGISANVDEIKAGNLRVEQEDVDEVTMYLTKFYNACAGILGIEDFNKLKASIMHVAGKINPVQYACKEGSLKTINAALKLRNEWVNYDITSSKEKKTFYVISHNGQDKIKISSEITPDNIKELLQNYDSIEVFEKITDCKCPEFFKLNINLMLKYLNAKLRSYKGLETIILKSVPGDQNHLRINARAM